MRGKVAWNVQTSGKPTNGEIPEVFDSTCDDRGQGSAA
jgi:hypothetical protein